MLKEKTHGSPFNTAENIGEGAEFDVKAAKENPNLVVKELKAEDETHLETSEDIKNLSLLEFAQRRYKRSEELMNEFGLSEYICPADIVIGHREIDGEPTIYLVQKRISGQNLYDMVPEEERGHLEGAYVSGLIFKYIERLWGECRDVKEFEERLMKYPHRRLLEHLDEILYRSLQMWASTLEKRDQLPIAVGLGGVVRYLHDHEGAFPEILNPKNIVVETSSEHPYIVDNGVIALSKNVALGNDSFFTPDLNWAAVLYNLSHVTEGRWAEILPHPSWAPIVKDMFKSRARVILEDLKEKYKDDIK